MTVSAGTMAALARPFEGGSGPPHSTLELIFTSAGAEAYLGEGNKLERVLGGLRALRDGRQAGPGFPDLPPDHAKLRIVATDLATRLLAQGLVDANVIDEIDDQRPSRVAPDAGPRRSGKLPEAASHTDAQPHPSGERVQHAADPAAVMVVHGRDDEAKRAIFDWLRSIGLRPREWGQLVAATGGASPFIGDVLSAAFREAQAVVVLFTPDEWVRLRTELAASGTHWRLQARPNVLFEAGMAFATHPQRTVLAVLGAQDVPTDLAGRNYVAIRDAASLRDLARRLERAGWVDISGTEWLDVGRFPGRTDVAADPD